MPVGHGFVSNTISTVLLGAVSSGSHRNSDIERVVHSDAVVSVRSSKQMLSSRISWCANPISWMDFMTCTSFGTRSYRQDRAFMLVKGP